MNQYIVVLKGDVGRLEDGVTRRLADGWTCQGGVSIFWNAGGWNYAQAMTKESQ